MAKNKRSGKVKRPQRHRPKPTQPQAGEPIVCFGDQVAQSEFNRNHGELIKRLPHLFDTITTTLGLVHSKTMTQPDVVVASLARMSLEDFRQILVLCSNGETTGGMKLLRGMFERVTTAKYIHKHPDEADAFIHFFPMSRYKEMNAAKQFHLSEETIARLKDDREAVKDRYIVDDCKKCGTKKLNHSWTKIDIATMAKMVSLDLSMVPGYYFPMQETHATMASIERRMKFDELTQRFTYDETEDPAEREITLSTTHYLALAAVETLRDRFKLEELMQDRFRQCLEDFNQVWLKSRPEVSPTSINPEFNDNKEAALPPANS